VNPHRLVHGDTIGHRPKHGPSPGAVDAVDYKNLISRNGDVNRWLNLLGGRGPRQVRRRWIPTIHVHIMNRTRRFQPEQKVPDYPQAGYVQKDWLFHLNFTTPVDIGSFDPSYNMSREGLIL
jgi:hypothetical protein